MRYKVGDRFCMIDSVYPALPKGLRGTVISVNPDYPDDYVDIEWDNGLTYSGWWVSDEMEFIPK